MTPRPILPDDFAVLARRIAGVERSLALNLYDPSDGLYNHERTVSVVVTDIGGEPLSGGVKTTIDDYLTALREVNFVVNVLDATYHTIDVSFAGKSYPGYDPEAVETAVIAAVTSYLSPATWGLPFATGEQPADAWINETSVRYLELAEVINRVEGFHYITDLSFGQRFPVTGVASTDVLTASGHGLVLDYPIVFAGLTGGAPLVAGTTYYARDITTNTFKVAATPGGAAVNLTTDMTVGTVRHSGTTDVTLSGPAPLTRAGSITGAVTVP